MYAPKREMTRDPDERRGWWILGGLLLIAALVAGVWYWQKRQAAEQAVEAVAEEPVATRKPPVSHPIESLGDEASTAPAAEQVAALVGEPRFAELFVPDDFVRRLVATVDNLPRPKVVAQLSPAKPPGGGFVTAGGENAPVLGAANFARYTPWIELIDSLDTEAVTALYRRLYPKFQAAYENLGNPDGYFNDRVIEVIDHLIAAPEPPATIELTRPNVLYEFADPGLEAQSAGRKLLIRMGPGNAARVKMKLREIRARLQ